MPKLLIEPRADRPEQEYALRPEVTTLGRRGTNDVVIMHRSVSGEHALIRREGACHFIEDLNSTNGTFVNGRFVKRQLLEPGDRVELGDCALRFLADDAVAPATAAPSEAADTGVTSFATLPLGLGTQPAMIKVLNGAAAGRELLLTKVVTTVGKPGVQLASISRRPAGFVLTHLQGARRPSVNGAPMAQDSVEVQNGDTIELGGAQMQLVCG
jgi:pSer/pThr/pTyr-binding forkhead associated (FHA) protein